MGIGLSLVSIKNYKPARQTRHKKLNKTMLNFYFLHKLNKSSQNYEHLINLLFFNIKKSTLPLIIIITTTLGIF